ncbi:glycosyltransferase family 4 protein [Arsenicibacter rosenii]|uniref:Glycosyl transferase family 1 domain-containing protein n=1 Tax=Arsenicibacter rosenii TaxID=1750698 RepID=A0A1S2VKQ6_9BACT|nr:glycosyltransferase family 4 protein [Arsenicibacter rosenii]OIN58795.1 hypothetical protein BLX24_11200 [Arsenicibacter rosenii]
MKVIVAHPGKQHSLRLASALKKSGFLYKYCTSIYNSNNSILNKILLLFLNSNNKKRILSRKSYELFDSDILQFCELETLLLTLYTRVFGNTKFSNIIRTVISRRFQKKLAKYIIDNKIDVVISFDTNSELLFEILKTKAPNVIKIIDHAQTPRNYLHVIYQQYIFSSGKFAKTFEGSGFVFDKSFSEKFVKEILLADYHIVASTFSKKGLFFSGISNDIIFQIPYGVDFEKYVNSNVVSRNINKFFKVLYVGEISQRKGISYILEASCKLLSYPIQFDLIGSGAQYFPDLFENIPDNVFLHGHKLLDELKLFYSDCSVFLFPTLGEGFGLVLLEALSAGLPVIVTKNSGGPDIIIDGYNGFIIEAGDVNAIYEKILYLFLHPSHYHEMSLNALESVKNYSWDNYEKNICQALNKINLLF